MGCCLHYLLEKEIDNLNIDYLKEMLQFANAAASIITTRKGALLVMPTKAEIDSIFYKF